VCENFNLSNVLSLVVSVECYLELYFVCTLHYIIILYLHWMYARIVSLLYSSIHYTFNIFVSLLDRSKINFSVVGSSSKPT